MLKGGGQATVSRVIGSQLQGGVEKRARGLDGLRGVAALIVVFLHVSSSFVGTAGDRYSAVGGFIERYSGTVVGLLWSGSAAVYLFFVLSGYALTRMLSGFRGTYLGYAVRRIVRLWAPYVVSVGVGIAFILVTPDAVGWQSDWYKSLRSSHVDPWNVFAHIAMVGEFNVNSINFVVWSLVHEMRLSLIFPIIYIGLVSGKRDWVLGASVALALGCLALMKHFGIGSAKYSFIASGVYQLFFVIGGYISVREDQLKVVYRKFHWSLKIALFSLGIFSFSGGLGLLILSGLVGGTIIVLFAVCSELFEKVLSIGPIQFLGKISYSFYLYHGIILIAFVNATAPYLSLYVQSVFVVAASIVVAVLSERYVEAPSNQLGRRLATLATRK